MNSLQSNVIKSKDKFINLKSDYFLQKLFNNLERKKALNIIKYTKNLMNRLNINIKDYKEYLEIYSSIEIELIINMVNLLIFIKEKKNVIIYILMIIKKK